MYETRNMGVVQRTGYLTHHFKRCFAISINGQIFPKSVWDRFPGTDDYLGFNLNGNYSTFTTTIGLGDDSESGSRALLEIWGDGAVLYQREVGLGEAHLVTLNVEEIHRFRVIATRRSSGMDMDIAFGDAKLVSDGLSDQRCVEIWAKTMRTSDALRVTGLLLPSTTSDEVRLILSKKNEAGKYAVFARKDALVRSERFNASFPRSQGQCRLKIKFTGTVDRDATTLVKDLSC